MKKLISVMMVLVILATSIPFASAVDAVSTKYDNNVGFVYPEEVCYTDLFNMYSTYLSEDGMADIVNEHCQNALVTVYEDYRYSSRFNNTLNAYSLTAGIGDVIRTYCDVTGDTNFAYNDALDEANEKFLTVLFGHEATVETLGADTRLIQDMNRISQFFNTVTEGFGISEVVDEYELLDINNPVDIMQLGEDIKVGKYESFSLTVDMDDECWSTIVVTHDYVRENLDTFKNIFTVGTEAMDMVKALYLAVIVEHARADIVEDILAVAEPGTALHDGLTRLDRQLGDNISDYIINTYIKKSLLKHFEKAAEEIIIGKVYGNDVGSYNKLSFVLEAASYITYDLILDVPKFSEVTTYMVLASYGADMCEAIKNMQMKLGYGVQDGHTITRYENLWAIYSAIYRSVLEHGKKLATDENVGLLKEADNRFFGGNYNLYTRTMTRVLENVRNIPLEERNIIPPENITYYSSAFDTAILFYSSGYADDNTIYGVNGYLYGNLYVSGKDADLHEMLRGCYGIAGDLIVDGVVLNVSGENTYTVDGDVWLCGFHEWAWNGYAYYYGTVDIKSSLRILGNLCNWCDSEYYSMKMSEGSVLYLYGDQLIKLDTYAGTVEFCGNEAQQIMGNHKNVIVKNPEGVKGDFNLYGELDANSNPVDGHVTLSGKASMTEDTRLEVATVSSNYTMQSNIYADTLYIHKYTMTVPEGSAFTVDGDIYISGDYSMAGGYTYYYGTLDIMGDLTVTGNIGIKEDSRYQRLKISDKNGVLRLMGELNMNFDTNLGTVVFCGTEQQTVSGTHNNIVVTNPEGVKGSVSLYGNFNSNGNPFEGEVYLYSNATLADDGTNYKQVYITKDFTLQSNIYADSVQIKGCDLYVAEGTAYVIDADVDVYGYYDRAYYRAALRVYGDLTLKGNVTKTYYGSISTENNSVLRFAGDSQQTIDGLLNVYTVVLDNKSDEGVIFTTDIRCLTLFDHNRNNYSVGSSSTFVDYDGDGIRDNEDVVPEAVRGDVNADGSINAMDSFLMLRIMAGHNDQLGDEAVYNSDINGDGDVNSKDSNMIKRALAGA